MPQIRSIPWVSSGEADIEPHPVPEFLLRSMNKLLSTSRYLFDIFKQKTDAGVVTKRRSGRPADTFKTDASAIKKPDASVIKKPDPSVKLSEASMC